MRKAFKVNVKKTKEWNEFELTMVGLTEGKLLAIYDSLMLGQNMGSAVAGDVLDMLKPAMRQAGIVLPVKLTQE